jgi:hypothetical protein
MFYRIVAVILIAASMACSRGNERRVADTPSSPTTTASAESTIVFVGGVSGPMDVLFPGRNESFLFRTDLETKYRTGLNRAPAGTFVDPEGELVWTQEYIRYRVNGCDHPTALARVLAQIAGAIAAGVCAVPPEGIVVFPSRAESLEFRRVLETTYQQMGRGLSLSAVDIEGAVIWIQEYLRYRANGCDHATALAKVFSQIDGGPVPDVCQQPCTFAAVPNRMDVFDSASSQTFEVRPNRAGCNTNWSLTSNASWLTTQGDFSNSGGYQIVPFNIDRNSGTPRTGRFRITFAGGSTELVVNQGGSQFVSSFIMNDSFRAGTQSVTECWLQSTATPCTFSASTNLPGNGAYTYSWRATYSYGGIIRLFTQENTSNTFGFVDSCGLAGSDPTGPANDLDVSVTITDSLGNVVNLQSGGNRPAWRIRLYTC